MNIAILSDNLKFSGGRKLLLEYAAYLKKKEHSINVLVQRDEGGLSQVTDFKKIPDFSPKNIPRCDIIIATTPKEAAQAFESQKGKVLHFCQGFEITDLEQRIEGYVTPTRYLGKGLIKSLKLYRKKISWKKKLKRIDDIYRLPTYLATVSAHLKEELEDRYGKKVYLCRNGVHQEYFYPENNWTAPKFSPENPIKIINIGPAEVTFKGIPFTIKAIEALKEKNLPVKFIRVTPSITDWEKENSAIDEIHENLSQSELGDLLRKCDVYVSNSTEGEGFGLPAMEALSCGLVCVLSSISSYLNFSENKDFCVFVPERDWGKTASSIEDILKWAPEKFDETRKKAILTSSSFSHEKACEDFEKMLLEINESQQSVTL